MSRNNGKYRFSAVPKVRQQKKCMLCVFGAPSFSAVITADFSFFHIFSIARLSAFGGNENIAL